MPARLPLSSSLSELCWQCQRRPAKRPRAYAQISQIAIRPTTGHNSKRGNYSSDARKRTYCLQHGRSLLSLDGPNATDFLHNLVPAPLLPLEDKPSCIASAFLNAKGRILHDVLIYKPAKNNDQRWLLDVDTNSAPAIMKLLKKHKLRSKFKLERLSPEQAGVFSLLPGSDGVELDGAQVLDDPRPEMGSRGYFLGDNATARLEAALAEQKPNEQQDFSDYLLHRMSYGHAEGPVEIQSEHALPQESNLDFYGGIDFHKGCYLGQELTIRTHHTGVVRKRILPVQIYNDEHPIDPTQNRPLYKPAADLPQPPNEANISKCGARGRSGKSTGKWLGGFGNIGLALCRLETMTSISVTAEGSSFQESDEFEVSWKEGETGDPKSVKVKAFVPSWLEEAIKKSIEARSTRSQKKRKEPEEEENELD